MFRLELVKLGWVKLAEVEVRFVVDAGGWGLEMLDAARGLAAMRRWHSRRRTKAEAQGTYCRWVSPG